MNVYSRLFKLLCYDMGSQCETDFSYQHLLEVLWQGSDDNVLTENGVAIFFLSATETLLASYFSDVPWLQQLAVLLIVPTRYNEFAL